MRVKPLFRAPVPAYWREISSPWLAHITLKRASNCRGAQCQLARLPGDAVNWSAPTISNAACAD